MISKPRLPQPDQQAITHSEALVALMREEIRAHGPLSFARYMELALYAPGLGYYTGGAQKFGADGDFMTAPEISPLFGQCLARQIQSVLSTLPTGNILEFGAGSGRLIVDILSALEDTPAHYYILELSPDLKQRQQQWVQAKIPGLAHKVSWLDRLPTQFTGVIIANEVLDAMPVHRFQWHQAALHERSVTWENGRFQEILTPPCAELTTATESWWTTEPHLDKHWFIDGYCSEINLNLPAWLHSVADFLEAGLILLLDYGFPRQEYYHPDRSMGTLQCHYRHHAHSDPFYWPGLQDITAHVDFTAVAQAAEQAGLTLAGYGNLANFLFSCGLLELAANMPADLQAQYQVSQEIKKLVLPSEMGELFKVMALTKNLAPPLLGFETFNSVI